MASAPFKWATICDSTVLPAAGAWLVPAGAPICRQADEGSLIVSYTRAAAGGYPEIELLWSFIAWNAAATRIPGVYRAGTAWNKERYQMLNTDAEATFVRVVGVKVPIGCSTFSCNAREVGDVANPGTIKIAATFGSTAEG